MQQFYSSIRHMEFFGKTIYSGDEFYVCWTKRTLKPVERANCGQSKITLRLAILVGVTRDANSDKIINLTSLDRLRPSLREESSS